MRLIVRVVARLSVEVVDMDSPLTDSTVAVRDIYHGLSEIPTSVIERAPNALLWHTDRAIDSLVEAITTTRRPVKNAAAESLLLSGARTRKENQHDR
jgi:hypothetical protein